MSGTASGSGGSGGGGVSGGSAGGGGAGGCECEFRVADDLAVQKGGFLPVGRSHDGFFSLLEGDALFRDQHTQAMAASEDEVETAYCNYTSVFPDV